MSALNPDEIECRWCTELFEGPHRRAEYADHLRDEHPTPAQVISLPPPVGQFSCQCGATFDSQARLGGHLGGSTKKREAGHGLVGASPPAPKKSVPTPKTTPADGEGASGSEGDEADGDAAGRVASAPALPVPPVASTNHIRVARLQGGGALTVDLSGASVWDATDVDLALIRAIRDAMDVFEGMQ